MLNILSSDAYNEAVFDRAADREVYLVGGFVRDLLLGRISIDRDYAVKGEIPGFLSDVVRYTGGKAVRIGKGDFYRIIVAGGQTLDFSPLHGDIVNDLSMRDYTINSIAWSPSAGLLDVNGGREDLDAKIIRMVASENLRSDPIRIVRGHRLAGEFCFAVDKKTRSAMRAMAHLVSEASSERITSEILRILNGNNPIGALDGLLEDRVLTTIIGCSDRALEGRIKAMSSILTRLDVLPLECGVLQRRFSQNVSLRGLLLLEILLGGGTDHLLTLSTEVGRHLRLVDRGAALLKSVPAPELFDIFLAAGEAALDLVIVAGREDLLPELDRFRRIMTEGLITGEDIIRGLLIEEGRAVGRLLSLAKRLEFSRKAGSRAELLSLLRDAKSKVI